jgi:tetratricopeptide (TPR) repeat protein
MTPLSFAERAILSALAVILLVLVFSPLSVRAEDALDRTFREALYAEEAKGDIATALKGYEAALGLIDQQRDLAATALYRMGECHRKLGHTDEAIAAYRKVVTLYPDRERTLRLAKENLLALGAGETKTESKTPGAMPLAVNDAEGKKLAELQEMVKNSPDRLNDGQDRPLHEAASEGQTRVVSYLLQAGAKKEIPDRDGRTPLHCASEHGHKAVCEALLGPVGTPCPQLSLLDRDGASPLSLAVQNNREAVSMLRPQNWPDLGPGRFFDRGALCDP